MHKLLPDKVDTAISLVLIIIGLGGMVISSTVVIKNKFFMEEAVAQYFGVHPNMWAFLVGAGATTLIIFQALTIEKFILWRKRVGVYQNETITQELPPRDPAVRLRELAKALEDEFRRTQNDINEEDFGFSRTSGEKHIDRTRLVLELEQLGIPAPKPLKDNDKRWYDFLSSVVPYAEKGLVEEAMKVWDLVQFNHQDGAASK